MVSYYKNGTIYVRLDKMEEAVSEFEKALSIAETLAKNDPRNVQTQNDLNTLKEIMQNIKTP